MIIQILGGIGLFLLGMTLLTDGLRAFAGRALRRILEDYVKGPASGLFWGLVMTAIVQSSSATTVTVIGFVGSGIMTSAQGLGVIFGSNLGTTTTGWLMAVFGLNYSIVPIAYPLLVIGAGLKILGRDRLGALGLALCGFSLIFVGIDHLQTAMRSVHESFQFDVYSPDQLSGRFVLLFIGAAMTVVMQSSTATMATVLAAVHAGAIDFEHGAAIVMGQNIGTTATAALASVGASPGAKRMGLAHIVFNFLTACAAFLFFPLLAPGAKSIAHFLRGDSSTLALAAFHTMINTLGVTLVFPAIRPYSAWIARFIPEPADSLIAPLDKALLAMPASAIDAARLALMKVMAKVAESLEVLLDEPGQRQKVMQDLDQTDSALQEARSYLSNINPPSDDHRLHNLKLGALHALDHLIRLSEDCRKASPLESLAASEEIHKHVEVLRRTLKEVVSAMKRNDTASAVKMTEETSLELAEARRRQRQEIFESTASGQIRPDDAIGLVESMRWLDRLGYHAWRTMFHLQLNGNDAKDHNEFPSDSEPHSPGKTAS